MIPNRILFGMASLLAVAMAAALPAPTPFAYAAPRKRQGASRHAGAPVQPSLTAFDMARLDRAEAKRARKGERLRPPAAAAAAAGGIA